MATRGPDWQCHPRRLERDYVAYAPSSTGRGQAAGSSGGLTVPLPFKTLGMRGRAQVASTCRQGCSFGGQVTMQCTRLVRR